MKTILTILIFTLTAAPAGAAPWVIDFTDAACDGLTKCEKSWAGPPTINVVFDNPVQEDVGGVTTPYVFFTFVNRGLGLGSGRYGISWDVTFDADVHWVGGNVGFSSTSAILAFDTGLYVDGPGVDAGPLLQSPSMGDFELTVPLLFLAGETYTFSTLERDATNKGGITFANLVFEPVAVVPLPPTLSLLACGLAVLGLGAFGPRRRGPIG